MLTSFLPRSALPLLVLGLAFTSGFVAAADPTVTLEELQRQVQQQQAQLDALAAQLDDAAAPSHTTLGGYGEMHYNALDSKSEIDFHRFVLFVGHAFDDDIRLFSELEVEHSIAGEGQAGEVELEQAYIEFDIDATTRLKAGLFLVPIGLINETHEPTTFYGVERNPVESNIIPSTWWEGGAAISGALSDSGVSYDFALHSGLNMGPTFSVRSGRQKVSEAVAEDLALTARLRWQGNGIELGGSVFHQADVTQGLVPGAGAGTLLEAHATLVRGPFALRALAAAWSLEGNAPEALEKDQQSGAYLEGAWHAIPTVGLFARYAEWDNGGAGTTGIAQWNTGFNWWPHPDVVIKFDLQDTDAPTIDDQGFNLGIGFRF